MLTILFAMCLGIANAARGGGVKGGKVVVVVMMLIAGYALTESLLRTIIFPFPLLGFWWRDGGTGFNMPRTQKFFSFMEPYGEGSWRFFEFISLFIYSLGYLAI
jgi:hypothetical protein